MKFREHSDLSPLVLTATTPEILEEKLEGISEEFDLIDLQYSTTTREDGAIHYSALALVTPIKPN